VAHWSSFASLPRVSLKRLTDPTRFYSPRLGDPSRLSFSGRADFDRNLNYNWRGFDRRPPALLGIFPDRVFNLDDLAIR
jgi:hypothetical protein